MLLKPMSYNVFFAALIVASALCVSLALAEPVFGGLFASAPVQDLMRQVIAPMFQA